MRSYPHVFEPDKNELMVRDYHMKGSWDDRFFKNSKPITLELGCGRGEYTVGLAEKYPDRNFLGMDIKGARMWKGATYALHQEMTNVGFVRSRIEFIDRIFAPQEVSEIWITFPDPQPKKASRRLVHPVFLNNYATILAKGGVIHLKTDSPLVYAYLQAVLEATAIQPEIATPDLYGTLNDPDAGLVKTRYEQVFLAEGKPITYTRFSPPEKISFNEPRHFDETRWR